MAMSRTLRVRPRRHQRHVTPHPADTDPRPMYVPLLLQRRITTKMRKARYATMPRPNLAPPQPVKHWQGSKLTHQLTTAIPPSAPTYATPSPTQPGARNTRPKSRSTSTSSEVSSGTRPRSRCSGGENSRKLAPLSRLFQRQMVTRTKTVHREADTCPRWLELCWWGTGMGKFMCRRCSLLRSRARGGASFVGRTQLPRHTALM